MAQANQESLTFVTQSPDETMALAQKLAARITTPMVLALVGDLGSGKTCFAKGLAKGLGVDENVPVTSPTYTIINVYEGRLPFYHADLYRLGGMEDLEDVGFSENLAKGVTAVEWADRVEDAFLKPEITIHFTIVGDETRKIILAPSGQPVRNLVQGLFPEEKGEP